MKKFIISQLVEPTAWTGFILCLCAFIVPRPGSSIDLAAVQAYLSDCKMAKQFWPERVEAIADLPRTASGKIQKFKLKEIAAAFAETK